MTLMRRATVRLVGLGTLTSFLLVPSPVSGLQQRQEKKADPPAAAGGPAVNRQQVLLAAAAQAGPPPQQDTLEGEFTDDITLPVDRQARKILDAAQDYIKEESWGEAARALQSLLEAKEDVFLQVRRRGVDGRETLQWTSVRAEANRLIGSMPEKGLEFYELQYGDQGKRYLNEAKKKNDPHLLAEVAQKYFHTLAGAEATDLLGTYHLDRGRYLMAALCYERLLQAGRSVNAASDSPRARLINAPLTLIKAGLAFRRAGEVAKADQVWKQLTERVGREGLRLGDRLVPLAQVRAELDRGLNNAVNPAYDWPLFGGNPSRSAPSRGSAPYLQERVWQDSTIPTGKESLDEIRRWIDDAGRVRVDDVLPACFPIATGGKLIYRNYSGVVAIDLKSRELAWKSDLSGSLFDLVAKTPDKRHTVRRWFDQYKQGGQQLQAILFENSTLGTLSADASRVYVVEDLAVPPHPSEFSNFGWGAPAPQFGPLSAVVHQSRLTAIDLESGKVMWEVGGDREASLLKGSYFLGPPLPLGGKLYVLTEHNAELRLVCLDPPRDDRSQPAIVWTQTLATARNKLLLDVGRRIQAVHLAYGEGILVCPTNAGAVLGIDLLSHSLVWAHSYREGQPAATTQGLNANQKQLLAIRAVPPTRSLSKTGWKNSAPVIADGKVLLAPPDGSALHCLNLHDGTLLWKEPREAGELYLGGVHGDKVILVGKQGMRALRLADGKLLWRLVGGWPSEASPSGQGVASGNYYYLPLRLLGAGGKISGEVCKVDLNQGQVVAHSPSLTGEAPGNLVFYDGQVVSQGERGIAVFPQLEAKIAQVDQAVKARPNDPLALLERGELRLYQGDLSGAVADLRQSLNNNPPTTLLPKIRDRLYETLTELLQQDWSASEKYLEEYRMLCQVPVPEDASAEVQERLVQEHKRRQERFWGLVARGREEEGKLVEAFQAYLEYGQLAGGRQLVSVLGDPSAKARPELWVQGRLTALLSRATPEQRQMLEEEIGRRWESIRAKGLDDVRRFVATFGVLASIGRQARFELVERLLEAGADLEADLHLQQLRAAEDPVAAARAIELLARSRARQGRFGDAVYYYRLLEQKFADVDVRDGKKGADLLREATEDRRLLTFFDDPGGPPLEGTLRYRELSAQKSPFYAYPFELQGELLPSLRQERLQLRRPVNSPTYQLALVDRDTNEETWSMPVNVPANALSYVTSTPGGPPLFYRVRGHLAVLHLGHMLYALDLAQRRLLWERNLLGRDMPPPLFQIQQDKDGNLDLDIPGLGQTERLAQLGPVTAGYVCLRSREGLMALDPVSGQELWVRTDVPRNLYLFGDQWAVYTAEVNESGLGVTRAYRGQDGAPLDVPPFAAAFARRVRIHEGRLLVTDSEPGGNLVVRLYDVRLGKDLWKQTFPPGTVVLSSEERNLTGVLQPNGRVSVIDLETCREVLRSDLGEVYAAGINDGLILQDATYFYIVLNSQPKLNPPLAQTTTLPNFAGLRHIKVNGHIFAFDKSTGELHWRTVEPVLNQALLVDGFADLPFVLFSASYQKVMANPGMPNRNFMPMTGTKSFVKATGKLLYEREHQTRQLMQFHTLRIDRVRGIYDLIGDFGGLRHYIETAASPASLGRLDAPANR